MRATTTARRAAGRVGLALGALAAVFGLASLASLAGAQPVVAPVPAAPAAPAVQIGKDQAELLVAVYLPGMYIPQLDTRAAIGAELAAHLGAALGRPATSRVYATAEALENDAGRVTMALVEVSYVATRLTDLTPLCVSTAGGKDEGRLLIMATPAVGELGGLRERRLAFAAFPRDDANFLESVIFEGELPLDRAHLEPARDAPSALSKIALRKADAVLLYEWDAPQGHRAGLRPIYESTPLPRPTLVVFDRNVSSEAEVGRLREIMARFSGKAHPQLGAYRPATADRYLALYGRLGRRAQHLPPLLELSQKEPPLRPTLPASGALPQPPLRLYAPALP